MKRLILTLFSVLTFLTSSLAFAGYDPWECRERDTLKGVGLQCISCGVQKYYQDKGQGEVVPSEKWMALLAISARAFRQLNYGASRKSTYGYGSVETENMKKVMIAQIQNYGFCTRYVSRDTEKILMNAQKPEPAKNLSFDEFNYFKGFIAREMPEDQLNKVAQKLGFKQSTVLGIETGGAVALNNMGHLFSDSYLDGYSVLQKRSEFKKKLNAALSSGYDVSGEKVEKKEILAQNDEDQGLKYCLEDVQRRLNTPEYKSDNLEMCNAMVTACDISSTFCGNPATKSSSSTGASSSGSSGSSSTPSLPSLPSPGGGSNGGTQGTGGVH